MRKLPMILTASTLALVGVAVAQPGYGHGRDRDLTREQAESFAEKRFERQDANNDGFITAEEAEKAHENDKRRMKKMADRRGGEHRGKGPRGERRDMLRLDQNEDGVISKVEFGEPTDNRFEKMDLNKDGILTQEELATIREQHKEKMVERRGQRQEFQQQRADRSFAAADSNGDGRISKAEAQTQARKRFDQMDTDGNGTVTAEERRALAERMRGARGDR